MNADIRGETWKHSSAVRITATGGGADGSRRGGSVLGQCNVPCMVAADVVYTWGSGYLDHSDSQSVCCRSV